MKKILVLIMCTAFLSACAPNNSVNEPSQTPSAAQSGQSASVKTMISPTDKKAIEDDWEVLGEVGVMFGDEYVDIRLATEAQRGEDGYMMWDDTQKWALTADGENNSFVLLNELADGQLYIDVQTENGQPAILLFHVSTVGITVTKYTYSDGAFFAEKLITPPSDGNNIYGSFPDYRE